MAKDFANRRSRPKPTPGRVSRDHTATRPRQRNPRRTFHGPSFVAGIVLGSAAWLIIAHGPPVFMNEPVEAPASAAVEPNEPVKFEFDTRLRTAKVHSDPQDYAGDANPHPEQEMEYLIQAASFQLADDATSLRVQLLQMDLPAQTSEVTVGSKPWFRVTVGPFVSQVEAGRAMTRLREQDLDAFLIKRARLVPRAHPRQ